MSAYESRAEVAAKIDWEGGFFEAVFGYGITLEDLPEDDPELREAWQEMMAAWSYFGPKMMAVEALLPDPGEM